MSRDAAARLPAASGPAKSAISAKSESGMRLSRLETSRPAMTGAGADLAARSCASRSSAGDAESISADDAGIDLSMYGRGGIERTSGKTWKENAEAGWCRRLKPNAQIAPKN